ncbi:MAG: DUF2961 domain-containing protein [Armatimonadetes bacterium]|nr:DUF2961 domain-containing protein [Armatimonadota bacterium]
MLDGLVLLATVLQAAGEPPVIPIGWDAYRQWERWAYQRIGARAYMRSTYDRTGGNETADAGHFLYRERDDFSVTLDVEGPGLLCFARYNHWHGSPWHYEVDGTDHLIAETGTADPVNAGQLARTVFIPSEPFPEPLAWTWSTTKGADLSWVPVPFERSFRMAYSRTRYGTGYYIYQQFVPGAAVSRPLRSWQPAAPEADVLDLLGRAGTDIAPPDIASRAGELRLEPGATAEVLALQARASLRCLSFSAPKDAALDLSRVWLRVTWDDRPQPSVEAPLPLFYGTGTLYNRANREYLVKALPVNVRFDADRVHLACYLPMPFFRSARIELVNRGDRAVDGLRWAVRWEPFGDPANHVGYFHATYRDHPSPARGHDLVLLDTAQVEGGGDWSGSFVGTSFIFSHQARLTTLEGDPRFFFDHAETPQAYGTGTEEWGGGGDYWGGRTMTLPLAGHPVGAPQNKPIDPVDAIESAYRFLLGDLMPFGCHARIQLEHGGVNESAEHYETVTYWYGLPAASLVKTDTLDIADPASEAAHAYRSPQASAPVEVTSRFELGPDHLDGQEIYPATTDTGRVTRGSSEFTLRLRPDNLGVMLRRKLDYSYPGQRAEVAVQAEDGTWQPAGIWYLAGSNTCVFSNPPGELDPVRSVVQTSNRRFRDDEFLLPRALTQGRERIRLRVRFAPIERALFPGHPLPPLGWSEMRYDAWCFVMPSFGAD